MSSKLKARDKEGQASEDSNSVSSEPESDKQPPIRWGDMSSTNHTTNEPSSASATVDSSGAIQQPASQEGLPTFAAAASAAAPQVPPAKKKKSRRAGFREQFLQQLRVMLDRESQDDGTTVHWSTNGHSFIIMDQHKFEDHIIPTYFDNPIMFSSFLSILSRWGFRRVPSARTDCYEFRLPTFRRLGAGSAPTAAAAANASRHAEAGDSIQVQQEQVLPLFQQVMAQINHQPASNPQSSLSHAISDLISTIQRQRSSQLPTTLNQNVAGHSYLQSFQQFQHPTPTANTLNATLSNMIERLASSAQPMDYSMSEPNNIAALGPLVMAMQRVVEGELERRNRVDYMQNAILSIMGQMMISGQGGIPNNNTLQSQHGMIPPPRQSLGSNNNYTALPQQVGAPSPSVANLNIQAGSIAAILQAARRGSPSPSPGSIQADSIAAILQAARRGELAGQLEEHTHARNVLGNNDNGDDDDGDDDDREVGGQLSPRKRKSIGDDDQYDENEEDDDSWTNKLRPRKKSPRK